jgi:hypothetical protein
MIIRIPQRTPDDCTIAMVMGPPYTYERVLADCERFSKVSSDGKFLAWWEHYLGEEGFEGVYCHFDGLHSLQDYGGIVLGILGMDIRHLRSMHVVAVDEFGIVDPADNAPDHVPINHYVQNRKQDGCVFHQEWLAVRKAPALNPRDGHRSDTEKAEEA